jgi:hypothetical protein
MILAGVYGIGVVGGIFSEGESRFPDTALWRFSAG